MSVRKNDHTTNLISSILPNAAAAPGSVIDVVDDLILVLDERFLIVDANLAFARAQGMHPRDLIGRRCSDPGGLELLNEPLVKDVLADGTQRTYERKIEEEFYEIRVSLLKEKNRTLIILVMKNITEVKRLMDRLYYCDKFSSIGRSVPGVAHEINNPLSGIVIYTDLLLMKVNDGETLSDLKKIQECAERCRKIVDNLLTFSKEKTPSRSVESINELIDRAVELRAYGLKAADIEVVRHFDPVSTVFVEWQQMALVMFNIIQNSEQAIVASGRHNGRIVITTKHDKDSRIMRITIVDNGCGIPPAVLPKMFEPFFTTKPLNRGTGLGLTIAHGIISGHGGAIRAESPDGGGACFVIELPTGLDGFLPRNEGAHP